MAEEQDFYTVLAEKLQQRWSSVDVYSISACFGFYSRGMKAFSEVMNSVRKALTNPPPFRTSGMRLLVMADDNPVDVYAVERFHQFLEPVGLEIRHLEKPSDPSEWVQFAVFDGKEILHTKPQAGFWDEALDLGINKLSPSRVDEETSNAVLLNKYKNMFDSAWSRSDKFLYPHIPTLAKLETILKDRFPVERNPNFAEREYEWQMYVLLHGVCHPTLIHRQFTIGSDRIDLLLGDPRIRLLAVEMKIATDDEDELKRLKGQVQNYRKVVRDLLVLLVGPSISAVKLGELKRSLEVDSHVRILHIR